MRGSSTAILQHMRREKMSIFKYFSRETTVPALPSSEDTELRPKEVLTANRHVEQYFQGEGERSKRGEYIIWQESERAVIGQYASEHGVAKAVRYYEKKLERKVPESRATLKRKLDDGTGGEVHVDLIPKKPHGRPILLPSELDSRVQVYVRSLRQAGGIINTQVVVAAGKDIVEANDRSLLMENGGSLDLSQPWAKSLLIRMNFVKRKASTSQKVPPADLESIKEHFLARVSAGSLSW